MGPFSAAFLRFLVASIFLWIIVWRMEKKPVTWNWKQLAILTLLGLSGIFSYNYFFFSGLKYVNAGRAAIIIANNPIFISLFSVFIFREKLTGLKILGIFLSVSGAIWAISRGHLGEIFVQFGIGEIYISLCVVSWVFYTLLGKAIMVRLSPLISVTYSTAIGTVLLFLPALYEGVLFEAKNFSPTAWVSIFFLGFFGTVLGFLWYYQGIQLIGPMRASIFINFVPISAIILSYFLLDEPLSLSLLGGAILVITGIYLTNVSGILQKSKPSRN
jgi:drug/metabolite transporter (DMT)-like permease